jgi:hypothetical protein
MSDKPTVDGGCKVAPIIAMEMLEVSRPMGRLTAIGCHSSASLRMYMIRWTRPDSRIAEFHKIYD